MYVKIILYISFIISLIYFNAHSEDNICSNKEDKILCMAENGDAMAMYVMGRREYAIAHESGDMSKALEWALKAMKKKERVAKRLLKMIYIQLGEGVHKDYIQAYIWLQTAIDKGEEYNYLNRWQERLKYFMSESELIEAKNIILQMNTD